MQDRLTWFAQGAMGDALMLLALISHIQKECGNIAVAIYTRGSAKLLKQIFSEYPAVEIHGLSFVDVLKMKKRGLFVMPPTFGVRNVRFKVLGTLLSMYPAVTLVSFRDKHRNAQGTAIDFDISILFYRNLEKILPFLGIAQTHDISIPNLPSSDKVRRIYGLDSGYIVVHPFAANPLRSLPHRRWVDLLKFLERKYPDRTIVITGNDADRETAEQLSKGTKAISLAGKTSFAELVGLLSNAELYVGVDTGVTHLASVMGKKAVVIGNLSNPTWLPTYNKNAVVLYNEEHCTCRGDKSGDCYAYEDGQKYYRCLYEISDATIYSAVESNLA